MQPNRIVEDIRLANLSRSPSCLRRRLLKILEELGETSEAYLSRTSSANYKSKTWDDYREEGVDTLIVMVDVALTQLPNSKFPPSAFLQLHIGEGASAAISSPEDMERIKFDVARAVVAADDALRSGCEMGFYGAVARGVKSAASLCYARIPGDSRNDVADFIYETVRKKLDKWVGRSTAKVSETAVEIDAKEYFEQIRDAQQ